jgi:glycosyltransferase involved in cell wall biosynthesis
MKILLVSDFYPPYIGGMENHVSSLAKFFSSNGYDVTIASTDLSNKSEVIDGIQVFRFRGLFQSLRIFFSDKTKRYPPPLYDPILAHYIRRLIKNLRPDVIHTHGWLSNTVLAAHNDLNIPVIITFHDFGHICPKRTLLRYGRTCETGFGLDCLRCANQEYGLLKSFVTLIGIISGLRRLKKASRFISVSTYVKQRTGIYFPKVRNDVIPNFMDPSKLDVERNRSLSQKLPEKFILFVGVLDDFKGLDDLIEGYRSARSKGRLKTIELLILGKPHPQKSYVSIPEEKITIINSPPRDLVVEAFFKTSLLAVPSRCQEACPTVVLEGISTGVPIFGTAVGGIPELLEQRDHTWIVKPNSPEQISELLIKLEKARYLVDPQGKIPIPENYLPLDPEEVCNKILTLYKQAVGENSLGNE